MGTRQNTKTIEFCGLLAVPLSLLITVLLAGMILGYQRTLAGLQASISSGLCFGRSCQITCRRFRMSTNWPHTGHLS